MADKRGLLIILVIATIVVFVMLVWVIVTYLPFSPTTLPAPTETVEVRRAERNCTSPVAYWLRHPEYYPSQMVFDDKVYVPAEIAQIFGVQKSDLPARLQAQLVAAYLNTLSGAEPGYIQSTIFAAYGWLMSHPLGSEVLAGDQQEGIRLLNLLEAYNLGQTGVGPCDTVSLTQQAEISQLADIPSVTSTGTPKPSETIPYSPTPQPTVTDTSTTLYTAIIPSRTPTRTTQAPSYPTPRPTFTSVPIKTPEPTSTPKPPEPTATLPPPPTATFTLPPLPTATYTLPPPP